MTKLTRKDVFMQDRDFCNDLKIKKETEEAELFELIMDSVCDGKGKHLSKEERGKISSRFKVECRLFKQHMKSLKVKPLKE